MLTSKECINCIMCFYYSTQEAFIKTSIAKSQKLQTLFQFAILDAICYHKIHHEIQKLQLFFLDIWTEWPNQTLQKQIRLYLEEQFDQSTMFAILSAVRPLCSNFNMIIATFSLKKKRQRHRAVTLQLISAFVFAT